MSVNGAWRSETSIIAFQILFAIVFFYPSKSSMVIAYLLYAVWLKDIVNSTLVFAIFLQFLGRRLMLFLFSLDVFSNLIIGKASRSVIGI